MKSLRNHFTRWHFFLLSSSDFAACSCSIARFSFFMSVAASTASTKLLIFLFLLRYCLVNPRCSNVKLIGLLGIVGQRSGSSCPTLSKDWKWMFVFMPRMIVGPLAFSVSDLSPLMRMKGWLMVLDVVTMMMSRMR